MRKLERLDKLLKIQLIHSQETGIEVLKENIDVMLDIPTQISLIRSLYLQFLSRGLTAKQKGLFQGTIRELRVKFQYIDEKSKERIFKENKLINLEELLY
ncbi:MAG: hypothetical protein COW00_17830 [Bdellovibrio sp. CG12_big_fil_rev_8_21_14_0_65_39_13]|nr:MAG: hypothetical protein COW78_06340 [Bdellovibrio sp. CG22_combo_CG10-13_8_21_14_all_39_27]PIQ57970.1 MAG: hypothetical protein COW00_17830 [Bdellovibrio sp. CG12_big_fil_rev_8_21_14_0_65_39_13]PIR32896.1 MAG: hypothetical protein COV37_17510 [Bdellovibrio sp. CG11_big_fil_rev_8_21_14_0_20_39_38]